MTPAGALRREDVGAWLVLLGGTGLLLARPLVLAAPTLRLWSFAALYVAIGLASLAVPADVDPRPRLAPIGMVLVIGALGVAVATAAAGLAVPVPWGAGALPLAVLAAVAEEALFRRAAYAHLARFGVAAAVVGSAVAFALVHVPAYGADVVPVDLGAGLLLAWQRWASGTWLVPAVTHAAANALVVLA